jgi:sigma-E factor negative regulatory protein RseB
MQIYHGTDGKTERDRLITLDGASREVVRQDGKVTCILPDHKAVVVDEAGPPPLPFNVPTRVDQLESFYLPKVTGAERIAGHSARKIVLAPRDVYRYGQTLWLDEENGLLLKAELRDENGKVVEQLMFTRLKVYDGPLPPEVLKPQSPAKDLTWYAQDPKAAAAAAPLESPWTLTELPGGFREEVRRSHAMPGAPTPVEHRVFSDGLASVSVFIEAAKGHKAAPPRNMRKGALNAYTRHMGDYKVTVLGDVPEATVRLIGDGVVAQEGKRE